jgi:hypothetical protein
MNDLLLQLIIVVAAGAFCFGCGYLTALMVTRNKWRREMIKRGAARYNNSQTGKWEWGEPSGETEGVGSTVSAANCAKTLQSATNRSCTSRQCSRAL